MPNIGDRAREEGPGRAPVAAVVIGDLAELGPVQVDAGPCPPGGIVLHPIGRIGDHEVGNDPVQSSLDGLGIRAVAADETVGAETPHVARLADRIIRTGRRLVGIGEALAPVRQQRSELEVGEPDQVEVEAEVLEAGDLDAEQIVVPASVEGELVVGDHIGALLRLRPAARHHHGNAPDPERLRREHAAVPGDDGRVLIDEHGRRPAPLADRGGDLRHLRVRVSVRVARIRNERRNRAALDLIARPRVVVVQCAPTKRRDERSPARILCASLNSTFYRNENSGPMTRTYAGTRKVALTAEGSPLGLG